MAVLHLLEQNATLRLRAGRLTVEIDGATLRDAPARKVRLVVLHGNVRLTTPALTFFLRQGAPVLYCSQDGKLYGVATSRELAPAVRLRAQFGALGSDTQRRLAQSFVLSKLRSSRAVLERFAPKHDSAGVQLEALSRLQAQAESCSDIARLRGYEGMGARCYYAGLHGPLAAFGFTGRNRRPPKDPVNAALSYGYALLLARVLLAVQSAGLHPEVGLLHAETRRNPALALDLMEEFRVPVVDLSVMRAFLKGELRPLEHFEDQAGGIYLNEAGRKALIPLLEARFLADARHPNGSTRSFGDTIFTQAQRLAAALERSSPYPAFYLELLK